MPIAQHVLRRGGIYHLRCRVPSDLVPIIGRREIQRSLATACPKQARLRSADLYARLEAIFEVIREMDGPKEEKIQQLLKMLDLAEQVVETQQSAIEKLKSQIDKERDFRESLLGAFKDLKGEYISFMASTADHERSTAQALEKLRPHFERNLPKFVTDYQATVDAGNAAEAMASFRGMLADLGYQVKKTTTSTVTAFLHDQYEKDRKLQDDAKRHIVNYITLFARITRNKNLSEYTRTDIVDYVRTLEILKNSLGKSPADKTMTVDKLIEISKGKPWMGETTIGKHVQHVKSFFGTANRHLRFTSRDEIDEMFDDIDLSDFVPTAEKRKSWSIEQLNVMFATPMWQGTSSDLEMRTRRDLPGDNVYRDAYWWLPVAALWTGARLEELAQLHHEDLWRDVNGVAYIRIHNEGDRRVKTLNSIRSVPVHSFLIGLGFLDLFDETRRGTRIWSELVPGGRLQKFGDAFSSHFGDYRRRCGLYERLRDFHSLRRTFITCLRTRARVDPLTVAAMVGHDEELPEFKRAEQTDGYTDYDIGPLKEEIERLDYAAYGLNLNLLKQSVKKALEGKR